MTPEQKKLLMTLVEDYAYRLRPGAGRPGSGQDRARPGFENIHFAWAGGLEPGNGHYYRIHGPTFLVEFDNTQNNANHIHTVWRTRPMTLAKTCSRNTMTRRSTEDVPIQRSFVRALTDLDEKPHSSWYCADALCLSLLSFSCTCGLLRGGRSEACR